MEVARSDSILYLINSPLYIGQNNDVRPTKELAKTAIYPDKEVEQLQDKT